MACEPQHADYLVNEKRIRRLMGLVWLLPIYLKPVSSNAAKVHTMYRDLLLDLWLSQPGYVS